jgi:hypothetical protein
MATQCATAISEKFRSAQILLFSGAQPAPLSHCTAYHLLHMRIVWRAPDHASQYSYKANHYSCKASASLHHTFVGQPGVNVVPHQCGARENTDVVTFAQRIAIDSKQTHAATAFVALHDLCSCIRWD